MKKTRKTLALKTTTLRPLLEAEALAAHGGLPRISVATCSACNPTYNPTMCGASCVMMCA